MCVSINGSGDLDFDLFDLETVMQVASKVVNLPSKFGHAMPLGSRIICHVLCDGRTDRRKDGRMDKSNAYCPLPYGQGHDKTHIINNIRQHQFGCQLVNRIRPSSHGRCCELLKTECDRPNLLLTIVLGCVDNISGIIPYSNKKRASFFSQLRFFYSYRCPWHKASSLVWYHTC